MDDTTIPFEFSDCDAFLNSLENNSPDNWVLDAQDNEQPNPQADSDFMINDIFNNNTNQNQNAYFYDSTSNSPTSSINSYSDSSENFTNTSTNFLFGNSQDFNTNGQITPPYTTIVDQNLLNDDGLPNDMFHQNHSSIDNMIKMEQISPKPLSVTQKATQQQQQQLHNKVKGTSKSKVTKPKKEKTSHNMIEKRYRTNINDKILALRNCVPSLRCIINGPGPGENDDLDGLTPASKLNKATVLTKATEYINHLQKKNQMLMRELEELRRQQQQQPKQNSNISKGLMMSMSGLMTANLLNDGGNSSLQGLFALPYFSTGLFALKISLVLGTVLYFASQALFMSSVKKHKKEGLETSIDCMDDSNSLKDIRTQSFLSNTRTFTIPTNLTSQIIAFFTTLLQVIFVNIFGYDLSNILDIEQKTYLSNAIDSQLSGGDVKLSGARLFYTFLKSFLLPPSANRYITQAVHAYILCKDTVAAPVSAHLTKYFIKQAQKQYIKQEHIRALAKTTIPEVAFQRLYNLAYNRPVSRDCAHSDEGDLSLLTDKANRTVPDLLAAATANYLVHSVSLTVLENDETDFKTLALCSSLAPPNSVLSRRVAVLESLLLGPKDPSYISKAMSFVQSELSSNASPVLDDCESDSTLNVIPSSTAISTDTKLALRTSLILFYLDRTQPAQALHLLATMPTPTPGSLGMLGFVSLWKLCVEFRDSPISIAHREQLENLAATARVWLGGEMGQIMGLSLPRLREMVGKSVEWNKYFGGLEDEGYASEVCAK